MTLQDARRVVAAAEKKAEEIGQPMNIAVADEMDYVRSANQRATVILQIEGSDGIRNLSEILSVPGIDVTFVGPYDLSNSVGVLGQIEHPLVSETMCKVIDEAKNVGITVGTFVDHCSKARKWVDMGVRYSRCLSIPGFSLTPVDRSPVRYPPTTDYYGDKASHAKMLGLGLVASNCKRSF
jgi:2-keto-3-deoxy-L-rhamnonate aldolase RhmA